MLALHHSSPSLSSIHTPTITPASHSLVFLQANANPKEPKYLQNVHNQAPGAPIPYKHYAKHAEQRCSVLSRASKGYERCNLHRPELCAEHGTMGAEAQCRALVQRPQAADSATCGADARRGLLREEHWCCAGRWSLGVLDLGPEALGAGRMA